MNELIAALRDCTFFANPSGFGTNPKPPKWHAIVIRDGHAGPACGYPFHTEDSEVPARTVDPKSRCGRPGCRKAFSLLTSPTTGADGEEL